MTAPLPNSAPNFRAPATACADSMAGMMPSDRDSRPNARFQPDDALRLAHHRRGRMWSGGSTEAVVSVVCVGDPVPERLIDGIFEGPGSGFHRHDFGAEQAHPRHVERLARGIDRAHV